MDYHVITSCTVEHVLTVEDGVVIIVPPPELQPTKPVNPAEVEQA